MFELPRCQQIRVRNILPIDLKALTFHHYLKMKIMKLCFIIPLVSTFFILFLFGCSGPMSSLKNISTIDAGKGAINALAFSPDGKRLAVASSEGIRIYDIHTDTGSIPLTGHDGQF